MKSAAPGLSIVVLTHNRRDILRGCLESLFAQSEPGTLFEIVVVDDGSTDGTGDMVRRLAALHPELSYHHQPPRGIGSARNLGIRHASGQVVAFVADDYLLAPDYVRTILGFFRERPEARVVRFKIVAACDGFLCRMLHAYHEASVKRRLVEGQSFSGYRRMWRRLAPEERMTTDHGLEAAGGAAFRRDVFRQVGLFDESLVRVEDTDFTRRLWAAGIPVYYIPFHTIGHRYGSNLRAALKSAFESGRYRRRYQSKYAGARPGVLSLIGRGLTVKLSSLYWACWRARQTGALDRFLFYLPFMILVETSTQAGFVTEGIWPGRGRRARTAAEIRRP